MGEEYIMRKAAVSAVSVIMCIFMLTGCFFFGNTLEERMTPRQRQRIADEIKSQPGFDDYFKDAEVDVEEDHIFIRCYFSVYMDDLQITAMKSYLLNAGYENDIREIKDEVEKVYGIRPTIVSYEFYATDGTLIGKIER